jgi:hypothetical protein
MKKRRKPLSWEMWARVVTDICGNVRPYVIHDNKLMVDEYKFGETIKVRVTEIRRKKQ